MATNQTYQGKAHAELLQRAEGFLKIAKKIQDNQEFEDFFARDFSLTKNAFLCVACDHTISSLEGYINQFGWIFYDQWEKEYGHKYFWKQYPGVINIFEKLGLDCGAIKETPYSEFESDRDTMRSPLHHIHADRDNAQYTSHQESLSEEDSLCKSAAMLNSWVYKIRVSDAERILQSAKNFIREIHQQLKNQQITPFYKTQKLLRGNDVFITEDPIRKQAFQSFMRNPFDSLRFVLEETTL